MSETRVEALSRREVADRYGICKELVDDLVQRRVLPGIYFERAVVFPVKALEAFEQELGRIAARRTVHHDD